MPLCLASKDRLYWNFGFYKEGSIRVDDCFAELLSLKIVKKAMVNLLN